MSYLSFLYFHLFFILNSILGSLICLCSSSTMMMWVGMEITSFFFIPILILSSMSESGWKYFISQGVSSITLFMGLVVGEMETIYDKFLVFMSIMVKLSVFPFFGWGIHLSENLSWLSMFLLGSLQKIPPLIFSSKTSSLFSYEMTIVSVISVFSLIVMFFFNFSIRWMMMMSSFFNSSWLIMSSSMGLGILLSYGLVYFFINLITFCVISLDWSSSHLSMKSGSMSWKEGFLSVVALSSLMGIPPLGTFWGKMEVLNCLIQLQNFSIPFLLALASSIVCFFYIKLTLFKGLMSSKRALFRESNAKAVAMIAFSIFIPLIFVF